MIPKDLFKKVRRIQITTSRMVTDVFAGQYESVFKGRGMEFDEVREYYPGDDVRTIDWNVTARTGKVHIKKFVEERELTVMLLVDASMSCRFASVNKLKSKLAAEIAAVLAFSAIRNNDKVGVIIFTDKIEKFVPPRKGIQSVLRVIREVLYAEPQNRATDITNALEYLSKVTTRKTVSFLISDFFESEKPPAVSTFKKSVPSARMPASQAHGGIEEEKDPIFKRAMTIAGKRHDLIAITLNDPKEIDLPNCGLLGLEDAETGQVVIVDTSSRKVREHYHEKAVNRIANRNRFFNSIGVDHIDVSTDTSYADEIVKFFVKRRRRRL